MSNSPLRKVPVAVSGVLLKIIEKTGYFSFPPTVRVESTNLCNANCTTCTRDIMTREKGVMDFDLFKKIADECAAHGVRSIHLHNFGEPLLDKGIFDKIAYATGLGISTRLFSNLSLIDADKAEKLIKSGLSRIKGSVDGNSRETFESIRRGLSFDKVTESIETLLEARGRLGSRTPRIGLTFVETPENRHEKEAFLRRWSGKVDSVNVTTYHNWGGDHEGSGGREPYGFPCPRIWQTLTVLYNGDVSICCMDYDGAVILGNVRDDSISDIFNNQTYQEVRRWHLRGEFARIPICLKCEARK